VSFEVKAVAALKEVHAFAVPTFVAQELSDHGACLGVVELNQFSHQRLELLGLVHLLLLRLDWLLASEEVVPENSDGLDVDFVALALVVVFVQNLLGSHLEGRADLGVVLLVKEGGEVEVDEFDPEFVLVLPRVPGGTILEVDHEQVFVFDVAVEQV